MKKSISLLLLLTLCLSLFSLAGCGDDTVMHIGVMSGPTGMGMAKMMEDHAADETPKYVFDVYTDPKVAIGDLSSGELDAVCLPTNTAAALSLSKTSSAEDAADFINVLAVNCLGSLYLLSENATITQLSDLQGKTIYVSVPGSTTEPIMQFLLDRAGVQAEIVTEVDHPTLVSRMAENASDHVDILVLPEPYVSRALTQYPSYSVALDLSEEWSALTDTDPAMGCIVVRSEFLNEHESVVQTMLKEYRASITYIADANHLDDAAALIVKHGIIGNAALAKKALVNLSASLVYRDGQEMKDTLIAFYNAIGIALPKDTFYYEGIKE